LTVASHIGNEPLPAARAVDKLRDAGNVTLDVQRSGWRAAQRIA
jgi:hypothetical protein